MSVVYKNEEWLTLAEAADYIGTGVEDLVAAIQKGKLRAERINRGLYVPLRDATSYIVRSRPSDFVDGLWDLLRLLLRGRRR